MKFNVGDLIELGSSAGIVVGVVKSHSDLLPSHSGLKFNPWPEIDPLYIMFEGDKSVHLWCGDVKELILLLPFSSVEG